ncbi:nucleotidyltransferase family protein [Mumia sp. DW29H23]|uniref:nucleotidyltransferase family protein n=1 Tax=Mumia sp. DW29H23 TaxID=3421241 RepID=UPI003D69DFF0
MTRTPLRPLAQLLVDAVSGADRTQQPWDLDLPELRDVAVASHMHRVTPAVASVLAARPDAGRWAALQHVRHEQLMRHLRAREDLRTLGDALTSAGIAWVAVKGPVLSDLVWPRPDMREYYDLDVVVDRTAFADAMKVLEDVGCTLVDRNWPLMREAMRAEVAMRAPYGTALDLHWDIAVPQQLRRDFRTDVAGLLRRSRVVEPVPGLAVPTLDATDTVLHLAFHAAHSGVSRLVWLADVRYAMDAAGFDADALAARARDAHAELPVALVLRRTDEVLGLTVPFPAGLARADRSAWARVARSRDRRRPFPGLPGDDHLGGTLYGAARRGVVRSVTSAIASRRTLRAEEQAFDARDGRPSRPLQEDVPDTAARAAYLRAVVDATVV